VHPPGCVLYITYSRALSSDTHSSDALMALLCSHQVMQVIRSDFTPHSPTTVCFCGAAGLMHAMLGRVHTQGLMACWECPEGLMPWLELVSTGVEAMLKAPCMCNLSLKTQARVGSLIVLMASVEMHQNPRNPS